MPIIIISVVDSRDEPHDPPPSHRLDRYLSYQASTITTLIDEFMIDFFLSENVELTNFSGNK